MNLPWTRFALMCLLVLSCGACSASEAAENKRRTLVLTGSSTVAPLAAEIGKRFEALHPGTRINVQTGGSSRGIVDTRQGVAQVGMVSRALKPSEQDLQAFTIALDGVALIVHRDNPIQSLSDAQVVSIYRGETDSWGALGGRDAPITVVNKAEGRSTLELFLHYFGVKNSELHPDVIIGDNEQGIKTVAGNPNAIGYVSIGTAEYDAAHGVGIKLLPLAGVQASLENVRAGRFPIARPLNFVFKGQPSGLALSFLEFAQSSKVHDIVRSHYFVPTESR